MKTHCPDQLLTQVLQDNVACIKENACLNHSAGSGDADAEIKTLLDEWLLPVCAVSPYIERSCLQFSDLLPRLCTEGVLTPRFEGLLLHTLIAELNADFGLQLESLPACPDNKALEALQQKVLRQFRHRHLVAILWRDLTELCSLEQTLEALSLLAECCVVVADQWTYEALTERYGIPCDREGRQQRLIVIGMGKLGGHELNVSSDIDLICVWPAAGETLANKPGQRSQDNGEFFRRSVQRITLLLNSITSDGFVYRVDTRLRPFGESGPLVTNFDGLEHYYLTQGRDWERYAMIKSRALCGNPEDIEALEELITPFVYRRYLDYNAFESLRNLKEKIELSVKQKGMTDNIKLGVGGIREIEFVGQAFQLVRGGRDSRLRIRPIMQVLEQLAVQNFMPRLEVEQLLAAYRYLRKVENAIQLMRDEQRHTLPEDELDRVRLLAIVEEESWTDFKRTLAFHQDRVARCFKQLFAAQTDDQPTDQSHSAPASAEAAATGSISSDTVSANTATAESNVAVSATDGPEQLSVEAAQALWLSLSSTVDSAQDSAEEQSHLLEQHGYEASDNLLAAIATLSQGGFFQRLPADSQQRIERIVPMILRLSQQTLNPTATLTRSLALVRAVAGRSGYLQVLCEQPAALHRLVNLFASSSWLASFVVSQPMVIDELLTGDGKTVYPDAQTLHRETSDFVQRLLDASLDEQMDSLRHYRQAREMRIACAQLDGTLTLMQVSDQLTWLAEALISGVIQLVESALQQRHGVPHCIETGAQVARKTEVAVAAYGKLGGLELGFGSDLDLVFLHDSRGEKQSTDGEKPIDNSLYYARLAQKFVHFMNTATPAGILYEIDLRLRPNGSSGVLVTGIDTFFSYQQSEAWTWEHQALMRARIVFGSPQMQQQFDGIRQAVLAQQRSDAELREAVASMRARMRDALGNKNPDKMHLKQDAGGVADIEFIVQYLVLSYSVRFPQMLQYTDNVRVLETAEKFELLSSADVKLLSDSYLTLRKRLHHLALQELPAIVDLDPELVELRDSIVRIRTRILGGE